MHPLFLNRSTFWKLGDGEIWFWAWDISCIYIYMPCVCTRDIIIFCALKLSDAAYRAVCGRSPWRSTAAGTPRNKRWRASWRALLWCGGWSRFWAPPPRCGWARVTAGSCVWACVEDWRNDHAGSLAAASGSLWVAAEARRSRPARRNRSRRERIERHPPDGSSRAARKHRTWIRHTERPEIKPSTHYRETSRSCQNSHKQHTIDNNTLYGSEWYFFCYAKIMILRSCSMKIFCTVTIWKLNYCLVICMAKNLIWTTLKMIFSIFRCFCTLRLSKYCPNHTSKEILLIQLIQMMHKSQFWQMYPYDWFCAPICLPQTSFERSIIFTDRLLWLSFILDTRGRPCAENTQMCHRSNRINVNMN